ncbi:M1 family metallopeptidase [Alkalisalibacterium limincola]|uniref:Aminopeptidase N n=1 Tax=Alkalisalibacterium limincola TaxID=2699169 RepID=A0A5C8KUJ4_9GAMM|nr:M1 family metallopeptidase [Alkalisalibacterium limincola]TXK64851.1 aminopeptidase [Alkalisalibacterium limincola]
MTRTLLLALALLFPAPLLADASEATVAGEAVDTSRRADEHSHAEPDRVRVRHLHLDLAVDFEERRLAGFVDLHLDWQDPRYRRLHLDTRELEVERVVGRNGDGPWRRLRHTIEPHDPVFGSRMVVRMSRQYDLVRVHYRTSPGASGLQWLEPSMTAGREHPFLFSQSQAIHARSWVPLQDTPSVRFTYSARIRTPAELMALMSADNDPQARRTGDYRFVMPQPIPAYLMAIAVGDVVFEPISARAGVWAEPSVVQAAVEEFIDTERMIEVTEALYGPYRWERYDLLILPPSFPYGGMENPRLSFITPTVIVGDRSLTALIAHELAHSWSGNLVTNASAKDFWLNEGFTRYVENRIVEAVYGTERAAMIRVIGKNRVRGVMQGMDEEEQRLVRAPLPGQDPDDALSAVAYDKGAWFLYFLEERVGREALDGFLRGYFDHFAFQSISSDDFIAYFRQHLMAAHPEAISEDELQEWLYGSGIPDSAPVTRSERFDAVDAARSAWLSSEQAARELDSGEWSTQEWIHFLEGLPRELEPNQLIELDEAFGLTGTANGELAERWYPLTVRSGYFEARPALAAFLRKNGRRKLIMPSYQALAQSEEGRAFARQVFEEARPGYHPITIASVEAVLAGPESAD